MARFYMNVDGKEIIKRLEQMGKNIENTQQILEEAGEYMTEEFKKIKPPNVITGRLEASIGWKIKKDNIIDVGVQPSLMTGRVEYYSYYQEYGTHKMPAHPYIRTGWEMNYDIVRQRLIDGFMELLLK